MAIGTVTVIPQYTNVICLSIREVGKRDRVIPLPQGTSDVEANRTLDGFLNYDKNQAYTYKVVGPKDKGVLIVQEVPRGDDDKCDWAMGDRLLKQWAKLYV